MDSEFISRTSLYQIFFALAIGILTASLIAPITLKWAFIVFGVVALIFGIFFLFIDRRKVNKDE